MITKDKEYDNIIQLWDDVKSNCPEYGCIFNCGKDKNIKCALNQPNLSWSRKPIGDRNFVYYTEGCYSYLKGD